MLFNIAENLRRKERKPKEMQKLEPLIRNMYTCHVNPDGTHPCRDEKWNDQIKRYVMYTASTMSPRNTLDDVEKEIVMTTMRGLIQGMRNLKDSKREHIKEISRTKQLRQ